MQTKDTLVRLSKVLMSARDNGREARARGLTDLLTVAEVIADDTRRQMNDVLAENTEGVAGDGSIKLSDGTMLTSFDIKKLFGGQR